MTFNEFENSVKNLEDYKQNPIGSTPNKKASHDPLGPFPKKAPDLE